MSDKPKNVLDVTALDLEGQVGEPIRVPAKGDGFITFPNPFEQDAEKAEVFMQELYKGMGSGVVLPALRDWLEKDDYDKLRAAYPSYRATLTIVSAVVAKMESAFGTAGEGDASES